MKQKKCHNYFTFLQEVLDIFLCFFQISFLQKDRDDLKVTGNIMILLPEQKIFLLNIFKISYVLLKNFMFLSVQMKVFQYLPGFKESLFK